MTNFFPEISDDDLRLAKKRVWNKMQSKLPERGIGEFQGVLSGFRASNHEVLDSRLRRVQAKERLLDLLPEREKVGFTFSFTRRAWASSVLVVFFAFLMVPMLQMPKASAVVYNMLEVTQGEVLVNGSPVTGSTYIQDGDSIYTGAGSMAHITFLDDSRITLGPSSHLEVLHTKANPNNRAETEVVLSQSSGRVWAQVVNLVGDSYFALQFPNGEATATQRSTFDVDISDDGEVELQVVRNLVAVDVEKGGSYSALLGQGTHMLISDNDLVTEQLSDAAENDVWWDFNLAYGKIHVRNIDERYKNEAIERAIILPGNPLYVFKTFRESVETTLAFSKEDKQNVAAAHAQNRLDEAQALIEQGDTEKAKEVLAAYEVIVNEDLKDSDNKEVLARLNEVQKSTLLDQEASEADQILDNSVTATAAAIASDPKEKNQTRMLSASQKLGMVPDLIADGELDKAMEYLSNYKEESLSLLVQLEDVSLDDREVMVSNLLDQKIKDLQMLRTISSMSALQDAVGTVDASDQIYEELSMMVLSLRERALDRLSEFFDGTEYDAGLQQDMYARLRDSADMGEGLTEQFQAVEDAAGAVDGDVMIQVEEIAPVQDDPRF